jgi:signal peptidase I
MAFKFFNRNPAKFSYAEQKTKRHRFRKALFWILIFVLIYHALCSFFFSVRVLENDTMRPGLTPGDRFVLSSFSLYRLLENRGLPGPRLSLKRGNIVLVDMSLGEPGKLLLDVLDGALRFFTAQRVSLNNRGEHFYLKRVIALPGDEVSMTNFVVRIRPKDQPYALTEYEVSGQEYVLNIPQIPALWDDSLPFSGNMDRIILGEGECFVLSDDRSNTNDSRTWGPIPIRKLAGRVLFRYWPPRRLGRP